MIFSISWFSNEVNVDLILKVCIPELFAIVYLRIELWGFKLLIVNKNTSSSFIISSWVRRFGSSEEQEEATSLAFYNRSFSCLSISYSFWPESAILAAPLPSMLTNNKLRATTNSPNSLSTWQSQNKISSPQSWTSRR